MPWEKRYDEAEVLDRAMEASWVRGYEVTSISDLVVATGINRGSLYAGFTDKRSLFLRALGHYDKHHRADFLARIGRAQAPKAAILGEFRARLPRVKALPQIFIAGAHIGSFEDLKSLSESGRLPAG